MWFNNILKGSEEDNIWVQSTTTNHPAMSVKFDKKLLMNADDAYKKKT